MCVSIVAPVGQTLMPSFGDILSPTSKNQPALSVKKLYLQNSRKVSP